MECEDHNGIIECSWDVMISYSRKKYSSIAEAIAEFSVEAGLRCWLDKKCIDQRFKLPNEELQSVFRDASKHSRLLVGFPDADELVLGQPASETDVAYNWRFYERQFAREFVWIDADYMCAYPDHRIPFFNTPHLAYYLALVCDQRDGLEEYWEKHLAPLSSYIKCGVRLVAPYHRMPREYLPPVLHPDLPEERKNRFDRIGYKRRGDKDSGHNMDLY